LLVGRALVQAVTEPSAHNISQLKRSVLMPEASVHANRI